MDLAHNQVIRIHEADATKIFRVIFDVPSIGKTVLALIHTTDEAAKGRGGRKRLTETRRPRKKAPLPLVGSLIWSSRDELRKLEEDRALQAVEVELESTYFLPLNQANESEYERRRLAMRPFLDFDHLREAILGTGSIAKLIAEAVATGISDSLAYKCFSLLCRYGFSEQALRPRRYKCGAPGTPRPCDPGGRNKPGHKTTKQRIAREYDGTILDPDQPGISSAWRALILAADRKIGTPKPTMSERCRMIIDSHFVKRFKESDGKLIPIDPAVGAYPNRRQIVNFLKAEIPRLQQILEKTTKGHFDRSLRGFRGRNWEGVSGPGHTWAIDSTIGDIYLRSSVNRAWIIGRPVVYIIVDVWSTAVMGFYVCLTGPSWDMGKISLYCSAADPALIGELWGYVPVLSLNPSPTMPVVLMCDRGEYLSQAARQTGAALIPCMSYAPPYRPDMKGLVEVLHRIEKNKMYGFVPGAIDQRRQEFELRRFNADDAVLTVREFVHYLYSIFTEYNLTADRRHRLDAHMHATGVMGSPAGLWRWGHEMGIGVRRHVPPSELITTLLPDATAWVNRQGMRFDGRQYLSPRIDEEQWTTIARNFGGWEIQANYFPGTVSKIWTPNPGQSGLLDFQISDYSNAASELTCDESMDAREYSKQGQPLDEHARLLIQLGEMRRRKAIVENAKQVTEEAESRAQGARPTKTEARQMEADGQPSVQQSVPPKSHPYDKEAVETHLARMRALMDQNNEDGGNE